MDSKITGAMQAAGITCDPEQMRIAVEHYLAADYAEYVSGEAPGVTFTSAETKRANVDMYPAVTAEEAERLFEYLDLSLDDVADCCNCVTVYAASHPLPYGNAVTVNMIMFTSLGYLFYQIEDGGDKSWSDYPAWVKEVYDRAGASEIHTVNMLEGEKASF